VAIGVEAYILADFRSSDEALKRAIQSLGTEPTALPRVFRGLDRALDLYESASSSFPKRRVLLAVGTGRDEGAATAGAGGFRDDDVVTKAKRFNVVIDAIGVPAPIERLSSEQLALLDTFKVKGIPSSNAMLVEGQLESLEKLSRATGGMYARQDPRDPDIGARMERGVKWILSAPALEFDAAAAMPFDGAAHRFRVELASQPGTALEGSVQTWGAQALPWRPVAFAGVILILAALLFLPRRNRRSPPAVAPRPSPAPAEERFAPVANGGTVAEPQSPRTVRPPVSQSPVQRPPDGAPKPQRGSTSVLAACFPQPNAGSPCAVLAESGGAGRSYPLEQPVVTLGREPAQNLIALAADSAVSGHHATLRWDHGLLTITDDQSSNGTFVNGDRLVAGRPRALQPGDTLQVGYTILRVTLP
jgi:hypothetical protein